MTSCPFLVETINEKSQLPQKLKSPKREGQMVLYGEEPYLIKTGKRGVGHPTQFDKLLEMAKISWAPVMECLSLLDSKKYRSVEELPTPEKPYNVNLGKHVIAIEREKPRKNLRWVSGAQIKKIHDDLIMNFGGELGIADETQLDAIIDRAKNSKIYGHDPLETVVHKAAFLMHSL
jgi:hypothetical protein